MSLGIGDRGLKSLTFHFPFLCGCFSHPFVLWIREGIIGYILAENMKSRTTFEGKGVAGYLQGMLH